MAVHLAGTVLTVIQVALYVPKQRPGQNNRSHHSFLFLVKWKWNVSADETGIPNGAKMFNAIMKIFYGPGLLNVSKHKHA